MAHAIDLPPAWQRDALLEAERFRTLQSYFQALSADGFPDCAAMNALASAYGLRNERGLSLQFVSAPAAQAYEYAIYETGRVPTREGSWHDLFNALAWCAFPATKARLNGLHVAELAKQGGDPRRSAARDVLTAYDESGMAIASADPLLSALLRDFHWKELFWRRRRDLRGALSFFVFGHAVHEQMLRPYEGITAKAVIVDVDKTFFRCGLDEQLRILDGALCRHFAQSASLNSARSLQPVPVLGIPDWWPANEAETYYDNTDYFRPRRSR